MMWHHGYIMLGVDSTWDYRSGQLGLHHTWDWLCQVLIWYIGNDSDEEYIVARNEDEAQRKAIKAGHISDLTLRKENDIMETWLVQLDVMVICHSELATGQG